MIRPDASSFVEKTKLPNEGSITPVNPTNLDLTARLLGSPTPLVLDDGLCLKQAQIEDVGPIYELVARNRSRLLVNFPVIATTDSLEKMRHRITANKESEVHLGIWTDQALGGMIHTFLGEHQDVEIAYWLDKDYTGRGLMTKSIDFLTHLILETRLGIVVYAYVSRENTTSENVLRRCGFQIADTFHHEGAVDLRWKRDGEANH